jgi:signal transduction histidine kinase
MNVRLHHSLAWRMILPTLLAVIGVIAAVWFFVPRMIAASATDQAILTSQNIAAQFKTIRHYYTETVVDKVVRDGSFSASVDYKDDVRAIPLPATMIHDLSALLTKQETEINLYSKFPFPNRKDRPLDAFQQEAWDFLTHNPEQSYSRNEVRNGRNVVRVAVADTMTTSACVNCHNTLVSSPRKDWKLGDVRGVLEVDTAIDPQLMYGAALSRSFIIAACLIGLVLLGITLAVAGSVTKPINRLVGAMQQVAGGNFQLALPGIDRRDEVGQLAATFRNMLSELVAARERETVNDARITAMQSELTRVARLTTMGQMTASIAHEIKQPLAAIVARANAGLRWLARERPDLDEARASLKQIVDDGHRASDVIEGIRAIFSKGDRGKVLLDVNELISEILMLVRGDLRNARVSVRTDLGNNLPGVLAHRVQLQLVFRNLITNAIEAMSTVEDRERLLHLRSEAVEPSSVLLAVSDVGTGIDPKIADRIFDDFFTTKSDGMGIGLSICRSVVTAHGGRLSATHGDPHGSVFQIVLPAAGPGA